MRSSLLALGGLVALASGPAMAAELRPDQIAFRDIYRELVETDTSAPTGSCTVAAGRMLDRLRKAGFGPDRAEVFVPDGHERTFAEMTAEEKNRISHRADAFEKLRAVLG